MGCCISTNTSSAKQNQLKNTYSEAARKSPPQCDQNQASIEEEKVKEIVHQSRPVRPQLKKRENASGPFIKSAPLLEPPLKTAPHFSHKGRRNGVVEPKKLRPKKNDDVSLEISSVASESVSTASLPDRSVDPLHHEARFKKREGTATRRTVSRSPGRRSDPSPNRNRSGQGRRRENSGEKSGRRSKSPVTRMESSQTLKASNSGRIQQTRRTTGRSPSRVGSGLGDRVRVPPSKGPGSEAMENPLVSLECFIFL